jgi:hypothetical protein
VGAGEAQPWTASHVCIPQLSFRLAARDVGLDFEQIQNTYKGKCWGEGGEGYTIKAAKLVCFKEHCAGLGLNTREAEFGDYLLIQGCF